MSKLKISVRKIQAGIMGAMMAAVPVVTLIDDPPYYSLSFDDKPIIQNIEIKPPAIDVSSIFAAAKSAIPTITIISPTENQTVSGSLTIEAGLNSTKGVAWVMFYVDNQAIGSKITTAPYRMAYDTASLTDGPHILTAKALNKKNFTLRSDSLSFNVDNGTGGTEPPPPPPPPPIDPANLILNPSFEQTGTDGDPMNWHRGNWGNNQAVFTYPAAGIEGSKAAKVEISRYSSGDAKWYFDDVNVEPGKRYNFSDQYISDVPSAIVARFTLASGSYSYQWIESLPSASSWKTASVNLTVPSNAVSLTIFHLIDSNGALTIDDCRLAAGSGSGSGFAEGMVTLDFDDGWLSHYTNVFPKLQSSGMKGTFFIISSETNPDMNPYSPYITPAQMLEMQSAGNEIGSHTISHPHLTQISDSQLINELAGSKSELEALGATAIVSFNYPYGEYNDTVVQAVKNAGYLNARTVDYGFNTKYTDAFKLKGISVEKNTQFNDVKAWIDTAQSDKEWLILIFHQVDDSGSLYGTSVAVFNQIIDYLQQTSIKIVTTKEGAMLMN